MKVSIITVCLNSAKFIGHCIESVSQQSYDDVEHIIVDGASTDDTIEIIKNATSRVSRILSEPDSGIYDAMNKGVRMATGDIIGILNSDDFFTNSHAIETVVETFKKGRDLDMVFGDVTYVSPHDATIVKRYYSSANFKPWKLRFGIMPPHPATFVRKLTYDQCGEYKINFRIAADYEMFVRWLIINETRYKRIDEVLVCMRIGGVSTAGLRSSIVLNREILDACKTNGVYTNWFFLLPKIPFKVLELIRKPRRFGLE